MKQEFLLEVLEKIRSVRIAIIGDFCLDAYWFVDESKREISIETGRTTEPVRIQKYGWRIPILSMYENVVKIEEVK